MDAGMHQSGDVVSAATPMRQKPTQVGAPCPPLAPLLGGEGVSTRRGRNVRPCSIKDCGKLTGVRGTARGLCSQHYNRWLRNGDPNIRSKHVYATHQTCSVEGCDRLVAGRSLCATHWMRWKRCGDPCGVVPFRTYWSERDIQRLEMILYRAPDGLGYAECGELVHAALILERTVGAVGSKLRDLRRDRRRAQNRQVAQGG